MSRIVFTGSTGAHKSTILKVFAAEGYPVLKEAATVAWDGGFLRSRDPYVRSLIWTQRMIAEICLAQEHIATEVEGEPAVILCDRGILDSIAYTEFARGLNSNSDIADVEHAVWRFCQLWQPAWTLRDIYQRYDKVVFLELPTENQWRMNNHNRLEDYSQAVEKQEVLLALYGFHNGFYGISGDSNIVKKIKAAETIVDISSVGTKNVLTDSSK